MLEKLETELKLRGFSNTTIKTYIRHNKAFLDYVKKYENEIYEDDIKSYLAYLINDKKVKPASSSLTLSALKLYYKEILEKEIFKKIKNPKPEKKIPIVLTKEEIKKLLSVTKNSKHKLLLEFMYSSGLRVSEAVKMKVNDLDLSEKMGKITSGKGRKDRYIILSEIMIESLMRYLKNREEESEYVFSGIKYGHLSIRMAQKLIKSSARKAGIKKRVFCHALRSSFATHLLESGTDIRIIQELLGHSNLSTTERYTKVSTEQLKKVKSPLDSI